MSPVQPWIIYEDRYSRGMGEVRVRVRLTNGGDVMLGRRGLLPPEHVRTHETTALVDTGTTHTVVPQHIALLLGLDIREELWVQFAGGRPEMVGMTEPILVEIEGRTTYDEALITGDDVLIGQTVLEKIDWLVDCQARRLVQNPRHPNGPMFRI